jgi:hypothetical protein
MLSEKFKTKKTSDQKRLDKNERKLKALESRIKTCEDTLMNLHVLIGLIGNSQLNILSRIIKKEKKDGSKDEGFIQQINELKKYQN